MLSLNMLVFSKYLIVFFQLSTFNFYPYNLTSVLP